MKKSTAIINYRNARANMDVMEAALDKLVIERNIENMDDDEFTVAYNAACAEVRYYEVWDVLKAAEMDLIKADSARFDHFKTASDKTMIDSVIAEAECGNAGIRAHLVDMALGKL